MKNIKKFGLLVVMVLVLLTGCGAKNVEGNLEDIMTKVYSDVSEDSLPMALTNIEIDDSNVENYLGTKDLKFEEALASESRVGSVAHSIVLVRVSDKDVESAKQKIKDSINPRKWICVEAENVTVESKGNLIIVIMTGENSSEMFNTIKNNFNNLK